jgi:predicted ATPase/class 3 adenylate cyclase
VTFLFTDVESSVRLWDSYPQAMRHAMVRHDALIERTVRRYGGTLVRPRGEGDSRFAVFPQASAAVSAATAIQQQIAAERWPMPEPLRVRVAAHTGEADLRDGDYYGAAVNRCARLRATAHGGQMLVSGVTASICRNHLPPDVTIRSLGVHQLRGLAEPEHIFELVHAQVTADFPPLILDAPHRVVAAGPSSSLPAETSSFVGREDELAKLSGQLARTRLLTLVGAGGIGKTRLCLRHAARIQTEYPDGLWLVELAAVADADLVPRALAAVMDVREQPGTLLTRTLVEFIGSRRVLIVLDNCEHLLASCGALVHALLRGCAGLQVLATSREPLGVPGEVAWRVPSLSISDSTRLFDERAASVAPVESTSASHQATTQICQRLDGIPLAIELAAARASVLSVEQIAARLNEGISVLGAGSRTALPRQQTLRAAIDWSYELLDAHEQLLFERLAAFSGGFSLEAVESICIGQPIESDHVLDMVGRLLSKSLIQSEVQSGEAMYRLLEPLRQYAGERLEQRGQADAVRDRHTKYFATLAESTALAFFGPDLRVMQARLEHNHDNLRAALRDLYRRADLEPGLRMAGALARFWLMHGYLSEGRDWLERMLARPGSETPTFGRAMALTGAGLLTESQDHELSSTQLEEAVNLWRELRNPTQLALTLQILAGPLIRSGDMARARRANEESIELARATGDRTIEAMGLASLGRLLADADETVAAREMLNHGLTLAHQTGCVPAQAAALHMLAILENNAGEKSASWQHSEEGLKCCRIVGDRYHAHVFLIFLAKLHADVGDTCQAYAFLSEAVEVCRALDYEPGFTTCLRGYAHVALTRGHAELALRLEAAAARWNEHHGEVIGTRRRLEWDSRVSAARSLLDEQVASVAWQAGRELTLEKAVAEALAAGDVFMDEARPRMVSQASGRTGSDVRGPQ